MSNIINIYNKNKEFIKYCSISIICTIILYLIYFFITKINPKAYILANFIAYLVSFSLLFYLNQKLFNSIPTNKRNKITQILDFIIFRLIGFLIDSTILVILIEQVSISNFWSKIISSLLTFIYNYYTNKKFVLLRSILYAFHYLKSMNINHDY